MKHITAIVLAMAALVANAQLPKPGETVYKTLPGTGTRDWNAPTLKAEKDGTVYQTVPGTGTRDWNAPTYKTEKDGTVYQTVPGTGTRDWNAPSYKTEGKAQKKP